MKSNVARPRPQIHGREIGWMDWAAEQVSNGGGIYSTLRANVAVGGADALLEILELGAVAGPELGEDAAGRARERQF